MKAQKTGETLGRLTISIKLTGGDVDPRLRSPPKFRSATHFGKCVAPVMTHSKPNFNQVGGGVCVGPIVGVAPGVTVGPRPQVGVASDGKLAPSPPATGAGGVFVGLHVGVAVTVARSGGGGSVGGKGGVVGVDPGGTVAVAVTVGVGDEAVSITSGA